MPRQVTAYARASAAAIGIAGVPARLLEPQKAEEARRARRTKLKALLDCSDEELDEYVRNGDVSL